MVGPFSSRGNQASDIAGVQLAGGFSTVSGAGLVQAVGGVIKGVQQAQQAGQVAARADHVTALKDNISGKTDAIKTALLIRANPALEASLFTEEALANPATAAAFAQFNDISEAVRQGRMPGQFALERLSVIQNDAIATSPEFEQEIRAAMLAATGMDPTKRLFSQLLTDQSAAMSPQEKFQQKLEFDAKRSGLTVEAFIEANNSVLLGQAAAAEFKRASNNGTMNLRKVAGEVNNRSGLVMLDIMQVAREHITSGGGLTPEVITQLKGQVTRSIAGATAEIIATAGDAVDPTEVAAALAPLEALGASIEAMIDDGSLQVMVSNTNVLNKGLVLGEALQFKDFAIAHSLGGPQGFLEVMKFFDKATSPQARALLDKINPKAAGASLLGKIAGGVQLVPTPSGVVKQYGRLGTGTTGLSDTEVNERIIAANIALQTTGGKEEAYVAAMSDLEDVSTAHAWSAYDNRKALAATLQSKSLQAKFIPLQAQQTAGLASEYNSLQALSGFKEDKFEFVGGLLQVKREFAPLTPQAARLEFDQESPAFVRRFNAANKTSAMYARVGILPATRYTTSEAYFKVIQEGGGSAPAPKEIVKPKQLRSVVRGPNGKLMFVEGF